MLGTTAGKYRIIDRIGRGSMGTVYRASDETLHRDVAIKVLNADFNDPAAGRRFRAEAIAIARLNHPGIAKIYDLFEHEGQWLMAIELVHGETLESLITRGGPLSVEAAADLASQALVALAHAHGMGVVHRDLKPANLMVADGRLKVMDFGIARVAGTEHLTSAGLLMGTPAYMAPEQVLGQEIDARTDIFAIGCVLFFLATSKLPFKGETAMELVQSRLNDPPTPVRTLRGDLPAWFGQVVERSLARDPAKRFQTAEAFHEAMARGLAGLPMEADPPPAIPAHLLETAMPGSMAIPADMGSSAAPQDATHLKPRAAAGRVLWFGAAAALAIVVAAGLWFWPRSPASPVSTPPPAAGLEPTSTPTPVAAIPSPTPAASPSTLPAATPATAPGASALPGAVPTPAASTFPTATPGSAIGAGAGAQAGRRGGAADAPISFETVKFLTVTGRKGEIVDATLKLGGGTIVALPRRTDEAPTVALSYKELLVATYVRNREPKWAASVAAPPPDLTLPTTAGGLLRRPVRNWLVLQGKSRYMVLVLSDGDAEQILKELTDRGRVKIDRPEAK